MHNGPWILGAIAILIIELKSGVIYLHRPWHKNLATILRMKDGTQAISRYRKRKSGPADREDHWKYLFQIVVPLNLNADNHAASKAS